MKIHILGTADSLPEFLNCFNNDEYKKLLEIERKKGKVPKEYNYIGNYINEYVYAYKDAMTKYSEKDQEFKKIDSDDENWYKKYDELENVKIDVVRKYYKLIETVYLIYEKVYNDSISYGWTKDEAEQRAKSTINDDILLGIYSCDENNMKRFFEEMFSAGKFEIQIEKFFGINENAIEDEVTMFQKDLGMNMIEFEGKDGYFCYSGGLNITLLNTLGKIFKQNALDSQKGWILKRTNFEAAILYSIFITQSIAYFIAYIKRFFYVIALSIMAPLVVIYDFLKKVT